MEKLSGPGAEPPLRFWMTSNTSSDVMGASRPCRCGSYLTMVVGGCLGMSLFQLGLRLCLPYIGQCRLFGMIALCKVDLGLRYRLASEFSEPQTGGFRGTVLKLT